LAAVQWEWLALACLCQAAKLLVRAVAWRAILQASYPGERVRYWSTFGAYAAGVGVNSVAPARGGDLVKLYLIKHRIRGATYSTLASTLFVETIFDTVVAATLLGWALSIGVLPTHEVYSRIPDVDWQFFVRHERLTATVLLALLVTFLVAVLWARARVREFGDRVARGFAILRDWRRFLTGVIVPQAVSWGLRTASVFFCLKAFGVHATLHNALLAEVVDSLATLFPATPGGAGTKQGLIVFVFRGQAVSRSLLLAFSVGMNIALTAVNVVLGVVALVVMARTLSFKRLRVAAKAEQGAS
jgi:uncharacterized membrane protein YbhN (UPF0104 family)